MNGAQQSIVLQATAVAIEGRALLIEGDPGLGKSSLALALIERGAQLIGDDGVTLFRSASKRTSALMASAPPNISGLIEVRGVGLVKVNTAPPTPVALILRLIGPDEPEPERLPRTIPTREFLGSGVPVLPFRPGAIAPAERAFQALYTHGLP